MKLFNYVLCSSVPKSLTLLARRKELETTIFRFLSLAFLFSWRIHRFDLCRFPRLRNSENEGLQSRDHKHWMLDSLQETRSVRYLIAQKHSSSSTFVTSLYDLAGMDTQEQVLYLDILHSSNLLHSNLHLEHIPRYFFLHLNGVFLQELQLVCQLKS